MMGKDDIEEIFSDDKEDLTAKDSVFSDNDQVKKNDDLYYSNSRDKLLSFVDTATLRQILDAFTVSTDLMANIVDINGHSIFSRNDVQSCCKFCKIIYSFKGGIERCQGAYARAGKQAALFGEPYIFRCPSGLIEWAAPIVVNGEHLGTIICGQVLMWKPEEFFWIELREMNVALTSDFKELFQAVKELPIISGDKVQKASYLLYVVSNYIMRSGWENYNSVKELAKQQTLLNEEIQNRKYLEDQLSEQTFVSSIARETEFMNNIKSEKYEDAKMTFTSIMVDIILGSKGNISVIKTRVIEMIVILSRTAMGIGVSQENTSGSNTQFIHSVIESKSVDEINAVAIKALDYYIKEINKVTDVPENSNIRSIKSYIKAHYSENITLDDIAEASYLSPGYASRLFKKAHNTSIMEYLVKVRMDEAKKMLHNPRYLIDDIAEKVGYQDSSYFTKVFKKYEGLTPTQYKNML